MAAVTSVFRAQQIYLARIDAILRPLGLTFARYEVLMLLLFSRAGALPLSKMGARLQVHPTSVTNAVNRLEEQGLLTARPIRATGGRRWRRSPPGRSLAEKATDAVNRDVFTHPGLEPDGVSALVEVVRALRYQAGDWERQPEHPSRQSTRAATLVAAAGRGAGGGGVARTRSA